MSEKNIILNYILEEIRNNQGISNSKLYFNINLWLKKLKLFEPYIHYKYLGVLVNSGFVQVLYYVGPSGPSGSSDDIVFSIRSGPLLEIDFPEYQKRKKYYNKIGKRFLISNSIISSNDLHWFFMLGEDYFELRKKRNTYLDTLSEEDRKYEIDIDKYIKVEERSVRTEGKIRELIWWRKKNKFIKFLLSLLIAGGIIIGLAVMFALGSILLYLLPVIVIGYFIYLLVE